MSLDCYDSELEDFDHHWACSARHAAVVTTVPAAPVMDFKALLHSTVHAPEALQLVENDQAAAVEADAVASMEAIIVRQSSDTVPKSTGGATPSSHAISEHELDYD